MMNMGRLVYNLFLASLAVAVSSAFTLHAEKLAEFEHRLDMAGLEVINNMYEHHNRMKRDVNMESDIKQITDESVHHREKRVRRSSVILDQVKAARKTGNREELYLRSSHPHKKLLMMYDPTDIVPIALTLDPPYNTMEKPQFYAVANYRNSSGSYESAVLILRYDEKADDFTIHANLSEYAPIELESFSGKINPVTHKNFLSVAGFKDDVSGSGRNPQVSIYEITEPPLFKFKKIQEFRQYSVRAMKYIEISDITYIILGMYYHVTRMGRQYSSPSQLLLMRFDIGSNLFHFHSSLPGSGVTDLECFNVRGKTYLTVANYRDNVGRLSILSFVYIYNEQIRGFEMLQYLSTNGARDIEHFTLANEEYLVVANEATGTATNKHFDVYSDVYKLVIGKFVLIQKLETYGAIKWKSITIPNCKQDVFLVYSDQRDDIDQVGIYSFSHDKEVFKASQFSIYHLDLINASFRPTATALSTYSVQDVNTGEYKLFLWIGASDTSQGSTIYELSYEIILTDSPLDAFKRKVEYTLSNLKAKLLSVNNLLAKAKASLEDAVTKTGKETISGTKTIFTSMSMEHAVINILNITQGSMLLLKGNKTYRTKQSIAPEVSLSDLESQIQKYNSSINNILWEKRFMYTNVNQNISASLNFNEVVVDNITVDKNVVVSSNYINNVNISHLKDIAHKNEDTIIMGFKYFSDGIAVHDSVIVHGKVNNLNFSTDVVISGITQNITALKIFRKSLEVTKNLKTGWLNGIDILVDALLINRPGYVTGVKKFNSSVTCKSANIETINGLDMTDVIRDRVTTHTMQNITGFKTFIRVFSNDNVVINGSINGIGVRDLEWKMKIQKNGSIIYGNKIFTSNITVLESLVINGTINGLSFPENILLKSSKQTIRAGKVFTGEVKFDNVTVAGTIDGMKLNDFVTLDTTQQINGFKTFRSISIKGDVKLPDNKTLNGIDLSEFAKDVLLTTDEETINHLTFVDKVIISNSSIKRLINNDSFSSMEMIFDGCLHLDGDQNITRVEIISNITVSKDVNTQYINNFRFPTDFASIVANQTFNAQKIFQDDVTSTEMVVNGSVNNIDIQKLNNDIITDSDVTIFGEKTVIGDVRVNGSLMSEGKINGLNFTEDLLFYRTDQVITAKKNFEILDFTNKMVTVNGNVGVVTTIDGVDLSKDWDLSLMTETKNETLTGEQCFQNTNYANSVDYVNDVDLSALMEDIVSLNTVQIIRSEKLFEIMVADKNLNTTTVDGVDVSELNKQTVFSNKNAAINGHVIFNNTVSILGNVTTGLIDAIDMNTIRDDFISLTRNEELSNLTVNGNVSTSILKVITVNNIVVNEDIIYRSKDQVVSGLKQFQNVTTGNLTVNGKINDVNLTVLKEDVVFKDKNQTITGLKIFQNDVEMMGSLESSGLVNDINLRNWNVARSSGNLSHVMEGVKTFSGKTTVDDLRVVNDVNGKNITSLFSNAVMFNEDQTVEEVIFENGMIIDGNLTVNGSVEIPGFINGINLTALDQDVLKTEGEQQMTSKHIAILTVGNISVTGYINGLNISEDLVMKDTVQTIRGIKHFNSIKLEDDVSVSKLINGNNVSMTEITADTLFRNATSTQIIIGRKTFENDVRMDNISTAGLVDGLNVTKTAFVTLNSMQSIRGRKSFTENFVSNFISVRGNVADVNLENLNRTRMLRSANQTITSNVEFTGDVVVDEDIIITELVNNIDLSSFNKTSPTINNTELDNIEDKLDKTLTNQCNSLTHVKKSLSVSAYRLDYFTERQTVDRTNIHHAEFFTINDHAFLVYSVSHDRYSYCTNSIITRWNATSGIFTEYQLISTSGAEKILFFHTAWDESYLLVINSKSGCMGVVGPSQLYKWNSTISKFQLSTPLLTKNAIDAAVYQENDHVTIFVSNANDTLSTWFLTPLNITLKFYLDDNPVSVHTFVMNDMPFVAVASHPKVTSSGYVNIYTLKNMTKVQSIASRGASSIATFTSDGINYIIIANDHGYSSDGHSTYYLSVDIYSYSDTTNAFEWFRSILTYRAYRVRTYQIGSFIYLAIVHFDKSVAFYQFGLELGFQEVDELFVPGAQSIVYMDIFQESHVFISSSRNVHGGTSKLLRINPLGPDPRKVNMTDDCKRH